MSASYASTDSVIRNNMRWDNHTVNVLNDDNIQKIIRSSGIYNRNEIKWYTHFSRFGCLDPYNAVTNTREYLFFTRPDLNIYATDGKLNGSSKSSVDGNTYNVSISSDPFFIEMHSKYRNVLEQLQKTVRTSNGPFMKLLSNSVRNALDMPSITTREVETSTNIYGTNITYVAGSRQSDEKHEFSLEFEDTKYLEVYMLFKAYEEYQRRKMLGVVAPRDGYIERKILHDQISIYKFIVLEDMETIMYYAKLTGCFPKSTPREAFSDPKAEGGLRYNVSWYASFVEDMNPIILQEFNRLVDADSLTKKKDIEIYDYTNHIVNGEWAAVPYIAYAPKTANSIEPMSRYKLRWKGDK